MTTLAAAQHDPNPDEANRQKFKNGLVNETSPYLLMHAHNPVNWFGWNEESLQLAKDQDKLIFLSIGYSSCHWCHVMERESFMDEEIASYLNEHFICIKVDREERPDVDSIYMESLRVVNRRTSGGWPLSMFLTPDAKPFFGGTYFPARDGDRGARVGFLSVVQRVQEAWKTKREKIIEDAEFVSNTVRSRLAGKPLPKEAKLEAAWLERCQSQLSDSFDSEFGGFRYAPHDPNIPKFPEPSNLLFLIDQVRADASNERAKEMLVKTCEMMMRGGIHDHLGGGFHRYSVDRYWRIPHFEKMLYDNGQLASVYAEVYEITGRPEFKQVVEELLDFVVRELRHDGGAFWSALDAESEGEEGKFQRWTRDEIKTVLDEAEYKLFAPMYGIDGGANFERKYHVPQLGGSHAQLAQARGFTVDELLAKSKPVRQKLFEVRSRRIPPLTDTKILASWNGMMIRGFADAGRILKNDQYIEIAKGAASFVLENMISKEGRLFRTSTGEQAKLNAYLPDYACVIDGLLAIHRANGEGKWLALAEKLQQKQDELFWDSDHGGYFYTSSDHESLIARAKKFNDGAMPSGNSVSAANLVYLAQHGSDGDYLDQASQTVLSAWPVVNEQPVFSPRMLITVRRLLKQD